MKSNLVVIFTYKYPYEPPTEQFLDMELQYLLKDDVDIIFIPVARMIDEDKTYKIIGEKRVSIHRIDRAPKLIEAGKALLHLPHFFIPLVKDIKNCLSRLDKKNIGQGIAYVFQDYLQAEVIYNNSNRIIDQEVLSNYSSITLYSYWLNAAAYSVAYLKKRISLKTKSEVLAIARAHGDGDLYVEGMDCIRPGAQIIDKGLDCIYSISENGCEYLRHQMVNNVKVSRLGVEKSNSILVSRENSDFIIVSCSVINENKRVQRIAEVLSKVEHSSLKWIHFGDGPLYDQLTEWCKNNMPSNIQWCLNGYTEHAEIMQYFANFIPDLFINFSRVEGIPVSIMEAMSYSIPVLATNAGAVSEIVKDGINGFVLPVDFLNDDATRLIEKVIAFNAKEKEMFRRAAYETWNLEYNAEHNFSDFVNNIIGKGLNND